MLGLRVLFPGELEEGRRRDQAAVALVEASLLRFEVEDRTAARRRRREAEVHRHKLDPVAGGAHDGTHVVDPDVVDLRQVVFRLLRRNAELERLHHRAVPFEEVTEQSFDMVIGSNFKGAYFTIQKAMPLLRRGSSVIINASVGARKGWPTTSTVSTCKPPSFISRESSAPNSCTAGFA